MRLRSTLLLLPASLVLFACAKSGPADGSSNENEAVLELLAHEDGPSATLTMDEESQKGAPGSSCWTITTEGGGGSAGCGDALGITVPQDPVTIERGAMLRLEGDAKTAEAAIGKAVPSEDGSYQEFDSMKKLDLSDGEETIDVPPGDYVVDVFATWDQGDSVFDFSIRVT